MPYVDGFVLRCRRRTSPPTRRWRRWPARCGSSTARLEVRECVADDVKVGKLTSFPQAVKLKPGEVVVFSWIVYKTRAARDKVNAKVMKDPRLTA